jgi:hypothetical protein
VEVPPKVVDKPEPPKVEDKPEPPKPEPPKVEDKPEPPKVEDKPEPPKPESPKPSEIEEEEEEEDEIPSLPTPEALRDIPDLPSLGSLEHFKEEASTPLGKAFVRTPDYMAYWANAQIDLKYPLSSYLPYFLEMCIDAKISLDYDTLFNRFVIDVAGMKYLKLSPQLAYMLGFDANEEISSKTTAKYSPELHGGLNFIYVYAPGLVENTELGGYTTPLLRIISIRGKPSQWIEEVYIDEQYKRLTQKELSMITIELRNSEGKFIPFNWGEVILSLKFKKDNAAYNI